LLHTTTDVDAAEVCVSGDGNAVGVTSASSSIGAMIFVKDGNGFQERGPTFTGYGSEWSGIALNYYGTIAAIGHRTWSSDIGRAGVFQWRDDNGNGSMVWMQMGSDITGDAANDFLGWYGSVSIIYDGFTVAVGAPYYDQDGLSQRGLVRVYNHDSIGDMWKQSGSDLVGDKSSDQFSKTTFSSDGTFLVVGAWGGNYGGYVKLFEKIESNYEMIGDRMMSGEGRYFGYSVDMSADGTAVAVVDGSFDNNKGRAYLLVRNDLTHNPTYIPTKKPSSIPSKSPSFVPTAVITQIPSAVPTKYPSSAPSTYPSFVPSAAVTQNPSVVPTKEPSYLPSTSPSVIPSVVTTHTPSLVITNEPSSVPSTSPSFAPTAAARGS